MNLNVTPFSFFDSYLSIVEENNELFLCSLHGKSKSHMKSMKLIPINHGHKIAFTIQADYNQIMILTEFGTLFLCFADASKLLIKSTSKELSFLLDTMPLYNYEYNYFFDVPPVSYTIINSYKNLTKYLVYPQKGRIHLSQDIHINSIGSTDTSDNSSHIFLDPDCEGSLEVIIEDIATNMMIPSSQQYDYDSCLQISKSSLELFTKSFHVNTGIAHERIRDAAYVLWSNTVMPQGSLQHRSIYSSNHHFPGVWSWDNCFMALAMSNADHALAWDIMASIFDHQDSLGQVPGSVSDSTVRWNFSKPPVQGYFFLRMMEQQDFSTEQLLQIFTWIEKLTSFYFTYKDCNRDGICEYHHGNDSGQDNSTVFKTLDIIDSPDLTAFLIKNYECLAVVSAKLGNAEQERFYEEKAKLLTEQFLSYFIHDGLPVARHTFSGELIPSKSLLPYVSIILENRLPQPVLECMLTKLEQEFVTEYGVATEEPLSDDYMEDAYWRGAIWGPTSLLIIDSIEKAGRTRLAADLKEKYIKLIEKSGFHENFGAKTGNGLRDYSFSWTAAVFLHFVKA